MTDTLKIITENTAKYAGGAVVSARYYDLISKSKQLEQKSGDEIVAEIVARAGLELA